MPRTNDAALEQAERAFNGVGIDVSINVLPDAVIDGLVFSSCETRPLECPRIAAEIIRDDDIYIAADVLFNVLGESAASHVRRMEEAEIAAALPDAQYDLLLLSPAAPMSPRFAADESLIHLDNTAEFFRLRFGHCVSDSVTEIPRGLITDTKHSLDLIGRHSLARFRHQIGNEEPFGEREVRVMEYSANSHGELIVACSDMTAAKRSRSVSLWSPSLRWL